jgi:hypothetical protein
LISELGGRKRKLLEEGLAKLNATEDALCNLQEPFLTKMDALIKQMFAIPAHTAEGRRAKATILLGCVLGDDWRGRDEETEYPSGWPATC